MTDSPEPLKNETLIRIKKYKGIVFLLVAALGFSGMLERIGFSNMMRPFDDRASAYLETTLQSTATAFAAAKIINSSISLLESSQIGGGVGVSAYVSPLKVLEPFDKTIEQFSDGMLLISAFCIVFDVLFQLGKIWGGGFLFGVAMLAFFIFSIAGKYQQGAWRLAAIITIAAVMLRVFIPVSLTVTSAASAAVADVLIIENTRRLSDIAQKITPPSTFDGMLKYAKDFDFKKSGESLEDIFKCTASILAGFIAKLVVIPMIAIWLMVKIFSLLLVLMGRRSSGVING